MMSRRQRETHAAKSHCKLLGTRGSNLAGHTATASGVGIVQLDSMLLLALMLDALVGGCVDSLIAEDSALGNCGLFVAAHFLCIPFFECEIDAPFLQMVHTILE